MTTSTLEPLISSRIRRTLLEHLLAHPAERFYLRGLAKELNLSVSPTRRELKRLERLRFLRAYQEANIRFYVVDRASPVFLQLTAALRSPVSEAPPPAFLRKQEGEAVAAPRAFSLPAPRLRQAGWKPVMEGAALSVIVAGVLAGVAYLAYTNQRLLLITNKAVLTPKTQVTVVESPHATASGAMRGTRWQMIPGTMGDVSSESY